MTSPLLSSGVRNDSEVLLKFPAFVSKKLGNLSDTGFLSAVPRRRRVIKVTKIAVIMVIVLLVTCCNDNTDLYVNILTQESSKDYEISPEQNGKGFRVLFVGDTGFRESYRKNILSKSGRYDYFLEKVNRLTNQSDLVIANLEIPLTDLTESPFSGKKDYIHRGNPREASASLKNQNIQFVSYWK